VLEDDFYRYLWDGRMVVETWQPYGAAPAHWFDDESISDGFVAILDGVNYPWIATVYGPTLQLWYALGYVVAPGEVWPLQVVAAIADIGVLLVLVRLCAGRSPLLFGGCVLYAWSPLLIKEFATTAHPDVLGVFFVTLALLLYCRERWFWLGVCLGLATGVKPFALVIAPFLIALRSRAMLGFASAIGLLSAPFLVAQHTLDLISAMGVIWFPEGLRAMGGDWLFNAPLYLLAIEWESWFLTLGLELTANAVKAVLLGSFTLLWLWQLTRWLSAETDVLPLAAQLTTQQRFGARLARLGELPHLWLVGVFLLVLPALNPWYLVWWLPFAVLKLRGKQWVTPWVASMALGLSYVTGINLSDDTGLSLYAIPGAVVVLEFTLIAAAVGWDVWQTHRDRAFGVPA